MKTSLDNALYMFKTAADSSQEVLDKFAEDLKTDPANAFTWGDNAVEAAAKVSVFRMYAAAFSNRKTMLDGAGEHTEEIEFRKLATWANEQALSRNGYRSTSSSTMTNVYAAAEGRAYIKAVIMLNEMQGIFI